jgi:cell division protein FtsW
MRRDRADAKPAGSFLNPATVIVTCAVGLTILGLTILFSASASMRQGPCFHLNKQLIGVGAAVGLCWVASRLDLDYIRRYTWWLGGILLFLLVLVLIPHVGIAVKGSRRWLGFGPLRLQISEFAKLGVVFCLAHYLALNQTRIADFKRGFLIPGGLIGLAALPVLMEPDFGTSALIIAVGGVLMFLAGARWVFILPTIGLVVTGFTTLVIFTPNRLRRMLEFLSEEKSYQLRQALAAFAAGGTEGSGLGQGRQQLSYLPEAHTDFIFSVVGEELGLWFTLSVVVLFTIILIAGLVHLRRAPNLFHFLLAAGCLMLICVQAVINLGVVTGVFPTKGMSLPFISAGLSNLLLMGALLGVIINTQRNWSRVALPNRVRALREVMA